VDVERLKATTRAAWSKGDYPALAPILEPAARALVEACAVSAGQQMLDVGAGTGNVAVLAAEEGALVVASDLTPALVEQGRTRTEAEGLGVEWVEADVEALPFPDAAFDCVCSCFGAIFAPRPQLAASELFRVVRPGGAVGLTSWTPEGYFGRTQAITASYQPPPEDAPRPLEWGREDVVRERLDGRAAALELARRTLPFEFGSAEEMWEFLGANAGPMVAVREALDAETYGRLRAETVELARAWNGARDGTLRIDSEYLLIVARRRG
jgi:SAM-dependent methyltransferase